jgi:hypothetical protein
MRETPDRKQVSPETKLRSFVDKLDPKNQKVFRSIRAALRKRFPAANELAYDYPSSVVIGYSPTDRGIEAILALSGRSDGVRLYFNQAKKLPNPKKLLQGSGKQARYVHLESARGLADADVQALITAALEQASMPMPLEGKGAVIIRTDSARKQRPKPEKTQKKK